MARFRSLIAENARQSLANESGCRQFDVLQPQEVANRIILYEVYDDFTAFQAHTKMPHVAAFFAEARPMIASQKSIRSDRLFANLKS
jgi:(4S)-4-hydroxy-5-phosphonooxypentane-2,3-dione isomerase